MMITIRQIATGMAMFGALLLPSTVAWADYPAGKKAYDSGDYATALKEWRASAGTGDMNSVDGLGSLYLQGKGVKRDYAEAFRLFSQAAEKGSANAEHNLAVMYYEGYGRAPDYAEAVRLYAKASQQGHRRAPQNLGAMYYTGTGVPVDKAEAAKWYRVGAENGRGYSAYALGYAYAHGEGVKVDLVEARMFLRIARLLIVDDMPGEDGVETGIDAEVAALEKRMTAAQIKEAKMRVIEWEERYPRSR
ncbi:MAG: sel1 repeat family protein [Alphaproteobacteria bacterium]|nr:sel1 repeat family protein [Alphaproteobacteria bacterium]